MTCYCEGAEHVMAPQVPVGYGRWCTAEAPVFFQEGPIRATVFLCWVLLGLRVSYGFWFSGDSSRYLQERVSDVLGDATYYNIIPGTVGLGRLSRRTVIDDLSSWTQIDMATCLWRRGEQMS